MLWHHLSQAPKILTGLELVRWPQYLLLLHHPPCSNDQIFEWVYYADGQARRAGISLGKFYHKIFLFPANFYTAMKGGWGTRQQAAPGPAAFHALHVVLGGCHLDAQAVGAVR
jgi:hypothetical protein